MKSREIPLDRAVGAGEPADEGGGGGEHKQSKWTRQILGETLQEEEEEEEEEEVDFAVSIFDYRPTDRPCLLALFRQP